MDYCYYSKAMISIIIKTKDAINPNESTKHQNSSWFPCRKSHWKSKSSTTNTTKVQHSLTFLHWWVLASVFTGLLRHKVVFVAFATAITEWLAGIILTVQVPALIIAIAWTAFNRLFAGRFWERISEIYILFAIVNVNRKTMSSNATYE